MASTIFTVVDGKHYTDMSFSHGFLIRDGLMVVCLRFNDLLTSSIVPFVMSLTSRAFVSRRSSAVHVCFVCLGPPARITNALLPDGDPSIDRYRRGR